MMEFEIKKAFFFSYSFKFYSVSINSPAIILMCMGMADMEQLADMEQVLAKELAEELVMALHRMGSLGAAVPVELHFRIRTAPIGSIAQRRIS